uniref:Selectin E n=1 Tax=Sinocyclocheilus anshuiensis TaxID=1608454 RepID=A0A671QCD8_9TELE
MSMNLFAVVQCPELISPQDGKMHCQHPIGRFSYQSTCEYMCEEGYTLQDSSSSTLFCGATGHWNHSQPTCEIVQCPELIKPQKGQMQCLHSIGIFSYQSTCEFMCEEGYTLRDFSSSTLFCGATGRWNDSQPTCEIIKCKPEDVTSPDHAIIHCSHPHENYSYDSQCEYSCEEGYELKGSSTTRCTSTTEWSSKPPTCELVQCPELISPQDGKMHCQHPIGRFSYQSTCEFMCEEGYTLKDSSSSTLFCGATGRWNHSQPTCESKTVIKCKPEDVTSPDHASVLCSHPHENFSYDSQCEYFCEEGYELKGSRTTRCTSTTEWSSKPPTCELVQCPELIKPQKGQMQCLHSIGIFSYQSTCEFMCEEGYTLRDFSSSTLFCGATGRWNDSQPTCESKTGLNLLRKTFITIPINGHMNCSSEEPTFGTFCIFSCYEGHQLEDHSNEIVMCNFNGSWSGEVAVCQGKQLIMTGMQISHLVDEVRKTF